ncbi:MAG: zinc-ribbon domain-containing protein [Oscillospiraceae bacterium]|jgi:endogenous inhibitor of DNA gyrase (YacG/DUF329 family)|nr:zinc-ribbon domain-containing protein [Oscillospiraceae bacterium]
MAIDFGGIGKKIKDTASGAVEKGKNSVEVMRLEGEIKTEETRIETIALDLGKAYYKSHKDDHEEQFDRHFNAIADSREKIAQLSQQITKLRGIIKCPTCGADANAESAFCPSCGGKIEHPDGEAAPAPGSKFCPNCGKELAATATFCTECGNKI